MYACKRKLRMAQCNAAVQQRPIADHQRELPVRMSLHRPRLKIHGGRCDADKFRGGKRVSGQRAAMNQPFNGLTAAIFRHLQRCGRNADRNDAENFLRFSQRKRQHLAFVHSSNPACTEPL